MIKFLRFSLFALALTLIFISCNQDPTSVGSNLIPAQDKIGFKQLDSYQTNLTQRTSYFENKVKLGTANYVLLGKNSYAESSILLLYNIYLPDSLLARIKTGELIVTSATMNMIPRYTIGDKSAYFDFSVYQIRSLWSEIGFDRDSLSQLNYDANDVKSGLTTTDTTITFNLSTNVVSEWLQRKADSTSAPKNYGLFFKPKPSSQKILGFRAIEVTSATNESLLHIILERPTTGYKDTVIVSPYEDVHVMTGSLPPVSSNFYLEGSLTLQSKLFFDLTQLPKNIIISKATLSLNVDSTKTLDGSLQSDSVLVRVLADSSLNKYTRDSLVTTIVERKGNIFSGDIAWMVQKWLNGDANEGVILSLTDETTSAARISFYGSADPNKSLRPKLNIIYLQKQ